MNKVVSLSIILAMVPCAGISAMYVAPAEQVLREPRGRQAQFIARAGRRERFNARLDLAANDQWFDREREIQRQMAADDERRQRQQERERYNESAPEGVADFNRDL